MCNYIPVINRFTQAKKKKFGSFRKDIVAYLSGVLLGSSRQSTMEKLKNIKTFATVQEVSGLIKKDLLTMRKYGKRDNVYQLHINV